MSGRRSRDKGARTERAIAKVLQASGFAATKISRAYQPGHDIVLSLTGRDLCVEVKARAAGCTQLYDWLSGRDLLIVKAGRREPLAVVRLSPAGELTTAGIIKGRAA